MASQVLSGTGSVSYTNNTGQNVRVIINYMQSVADLPSTTRLDLFWGNNARALASVNSTSTFSIGRNLASAMYRFSAGTSGGGSGVISASNAALPLADNINPIVGLPTELMLSPGQTFSATCGNHNIVVIPEAG